LTLRTRLLIGLVLLAATGITVTGIVTHREQKSFLLKRVNQQLASAFANPKQFQATLNAPGSTQARLVPFGTYAEVRLDNGTVEPIAPEGMEHIAKPQLPAKVPIGDSFTVHRPDYRVQAGRVSVKDPRDFAPATPATLVVAIPLRDVNDALHRLLIVEFVVGAAVLLALALLAWWVIKIGLRPLRQMQQTAGAIAAGDRSRRVEIPDEHTEVGQLGIALNQMLQQIERAFDERAASEARLRRFVGDASHELRTPLTSIRGYAELFRRGAADRPEDLAKAMRRIEEEADRMGVLVDDLLLLARLDQGRPLERAPVDLTRIAADAVDDARAVAPQRPITLWPNGAVVVPGDEVRLRQVMSNLLQNAVSHTPVDTAVHVRVTADDNDAVIEVRDEGPGMAPEDASRVFERFWRSDTSRARASGGTGLGLAIVAAIAEAHGGSASVDTEPGHGATFRVQLPITPGPDEGPRFEAEAEADADTDAPADGPDPASAVQHPPGTGAQIPIAELEETP
jgi:two-component system, OmpR family, sensor kinase